MVAVMPSERILPADLARLLPKSHRNIATPAACNTATKLTARKPIATMSGITLRERSNHQRLTGASSLLGVNDRKTKFTRDNMRIRPDRTPTHDVVSWR